jgi:hypothetical protein
MSESVNRRWSARASWGVSLLALVTAACGSTSSNGNNGHQGSGGAGPGSGGSSSGVPVITQGVDPGRVEIHRLNNTEYDNTVRHLLGTKAAPAAKFLAEEGLNFDNTATALGMTSSQYDAYFGAARDLMTEAAATPAELSSFMTCTPTQAAGDACAKQVVETFGAKIYRRPLEAAEVARAMKVFDADVVRPGSTGQDALLLTVRAMLSAANFLYRIEYDADPASKVPHSLSAYELASRLSYLHWSSMPDDALFAAAKDGSLLQPATLVAQVDRMLADGQSAAFIESFAGQWLDIRKLVSHSVTPQVFPTFTPELSDAMAQEGYLWFQEFVNGDRPLSDWFTADFNVVNDALAKHYGMPLVNSATPKHVEVTTDQRKGFFGLASFLTQTSFPSRTSPTLRGAWVLSELLCSPPPPPPNNVPKLDESATPAEMMQPAGTENVKARLERHRADPTCAGCHRILDPIGLGLERFDGIGRYREAYGNGDAIDPAGMLPDGTAFAGPDQLGPLIGQDPRFTACVQSKLYTYALGRDVEAYDTPSLQNVQAAWAKRGPLTIRNLMKEIVLSDAFRFRRGEAP